MIERLAMAYKRHGILPEHGGYLDQDHETMEQIELWLTLYGQEAERVIRELKKPNGR